MKKQWIFLMAVFCLSIFSGCRTLYKEEIGQDMEFEVIEEGKIPSEMAEIIEKKKKEAFQITYEADGDLYIGQGYGKKEMTGYEIEVDLCQSSENFVHFHTILTGPTKKTEENEWSCPYIVVRVKGEEKQVIFLNE